MLVLEKQNHIGFSEYRTAPWGICKTPEIPDPVSVFQIMMNLIQLNPQRNKEPLRKLKKAISLLMWLVCICSSVSVSGWWESRAPAQLVVFTHFYRTSSLVSSEDEVSLGSKMDWWKKLTPYRMYRTSLPYWRNKKDKKKTNESEKNCVHFAVMMLLWTNRSEHLEVNLCWQLKSYKLNYTIYHSWITIIITPSMN